MTTGERLTFLVDSNVFMTLEPYGTPAESEPYELATRFLRLTQEHGHRVAIHGATRDDILRDRDQGRRDHSLRALEKYLVLDGVPMSTRLIGAFGVSENEQVDAAIASALDQRAAHVLVTEDLRLRRRILAAASDIGDRVRSLAQAVEFLDALHPPPKAPPPLVERAPCFKLDLADPIFESIRTDYAPTFDEWFKEKCQLGRRDAFVIWREEGLAALCILKDETDNEFGLPEPRMKLCTLKVAEASRGQRLGELLIKAALDDAIARNLTGLSVTVLEKHGELIALLGELGFELLPSRTHLDELVFFRSVQAPADAASIEPFELNRRFGPRVLAVDVPMHVVPIQPQWEERLFPEGRLQLDLLGGFVACGNGLRKAYLSRSLNRQVNRGDLVLFYRSVDEQAVRFIGVVEDTLASSNHLELVQFVGTRTVYTEEEIAGMTENGTREVNAILFRQARQIEPGLHLSALRQHGVVARAPQSIQRVSGGGEEWLREQLAA